MSEIMKQWEFDNWSIDHWDEIREGKVDKTRSWIEFLDNDDENDRTWDWKITVFKNCEAVMEVLTYRDQWGTWIDFKVGDSSVTFAQEDGTKSFMDAFIASLNRLKPITDIKTIPPTEIV